MKALLPVTVALAVALSACGKKPKPSELDAAQCQAIVDKSVQLSTPPGADPATVAKLKETLQSGHERCIEGRAFDRKYHDCVMAAADYAALAICSTDLLQRGRKPL